MNFLVVLIVVFSCFISNLQMIKSFSSNKKEIKHMEASSEEYPYNVRFKVSGDNAFVVGFFLQGDICYGSIIDEFWILTVARCLKDIEIARKNNRPYVIAVVGYDYADEKGVWSQEEFNNMYYSIDITSENRIYNYTISQLSIIRVKRRFDWSNKVAPVAIPKQCDYLDVDDEAIVASFKKNNPPTYLVESIIAGKLKVIDIEKCNYKHFRKNNIKDYYCVLSENYKTCWGGIGSGMIIWRAGKKVIYGVLEAFSRDHPCMINRATGQATHVAYYSDWIKKTIKSDYLKRDNYSLNN